MNPDRIVIGVESDKAREILLRLYKPLNARVVSTDIKSAELIKHASNAFLATKISFINAVSRICDIVGADIEEVSCGMGLDKRIGPDFLDAGLGYGGSCFPKDLAAFLTISARLGYDFRLLREVKRVNDEQKELFIARIKEALWIIKGKNIGVLGLSFKPNTDDLRNSPATGLVELLQKEGARIKVYDPEAMHKARKVFPGIKFCKDPYTVAAGSDCLVIATGWEEFKKLNLVKIKRLLKRPLIIDGRNIYDPFEMLKLGLSYISIGRKGV